MPKHYNRLFYAHLTFFTKGYAAKIGTSATTILLCLGSHDGYKKREDKSYKKKTSDQRIYPSIRVICKETNLDRKTVEKAIRVLIAAKLIFIESGQRDRKANRYFIDHPSQWLDIAALDLPLAMAKNSPTGSGFDKKLSQPTNSEPTKRGIRIQSRVGIPPEAWNLKMFADYFWESVINWNHTLGNNIGFTPIGGKIPSGKITAKMRDLRQAYAWSKLELYDFLTILSDNFPRFSAEGSYINSDPKARKLQDLSVEDLNELGNDGIDELLDFEDGLHLDDQCLSNPILIAKVIVIMQERKAEIPLLVDQPKVQINQDNSLYDPMSKNMVVRQAENTSPAIPTNSTSLETTISVPVKINSLNMNPTIIKSPAEPTIRNICDEQDMNEEDIDLDYYNCEIINLHELDGNPVGEISDSSEYL